MASNRTYRLLGRSVRVELDDSAGARVLARELSVYPSVGDSEPADLVVRYRPVVGSSGALFNPRPHEEYDDGFLIRYPTADVRFILDNGNVQSVDFYTSTSTSRMISSLRKIADMQFSSREDRAGMVFHELVAVPAAHWMPDLAVVHASAFMDPSGKAVLVGGTGGVGKTSLAIELCLNHGFDFVADDISFVARNGHVWPNLAYPKIYAYNLEDNPALAERVFAERSRIDKLHWALHRRRGPSHVRRRLAPGDLYESYSADGGPLGRYVVLVREDRAQILVSEISAAKAACLSVSIMPAEYFQFYNHLHWHRFNRIIEGAGPSITVEGTMARWEDLLASVFEDARCFVIRIPSDMDHSVFKRQAAELLLSAA